MLEMLTGVDEGRQTESENGCILKLQDNGAVDDIHEERQVARPSECTGHVAEHGGHQLQHKRMDNCLTTFNRTYGHLS